MISAKVIDAHAHCGVIDRSAPQSFEDYFSAVKGTSIEAAVMFPPVAEIYDRYDPFFTDTPEWRKQRAASNQYLPGLKNREIEVIPYFFIWNDFAVDQLCPEHRGIKWHRHPDEPVYNYDCPECRSALEEIRRRKMPVVLEEELSNTARFVNELARGIRVIIPHLGLLNGGFRAIEKHGLWENPGVFADTSLASPGTVREYISRYGHERLFFGSDFPFGDPAAELEKITGLCLGKKAEEAVTGGNIKALLAEVRRT